MVAEKSFSRGSDASVDEGVEVIEAAEAVAGEVG